MLKKLLSLLLFSLLFMSTNYAQEPESFILSEAYFIKNANVVTDYQASPQKMSISIQNGLIVDIGKNIQRPNGALVIDAKDSLWVYPSFIDPCSFTAIKNVDIPNEDWKLTDLNNVAKPQVEKNDKTVTNMQKQGFGISNAMPRGRMLPGTSTLFFLDKELNPVVSSYNGQVFGQLYGLRGVYPSNLLGVLAQYKEFFYQAKDFQQQKKNYIKNPKGNIPPSYDKQLEKLFPIINNQSSLLLRASGSLNIARAVRLKKELNIPMTIVDARHFEPQIQNIKKNNIDLFMSLKLPKEIKKDTTAKNQNTIDFENKRYDSYKSRLAQASLLEKNNIDFCFSLLQTSPKDIQKNIKTLVDNGLTKKTALKALTYNPANYLGIYNMTGSIEKGKMANLIVLDTAFLEGDFFVHHIMTNGQLQSFEKKIKEKKKKKESNKSSTFIGEWNISVDLGNSVEKGILSIQKTDKLTGTLSHESDPTNVFTLENIKQKENSLQFESTINVSGQTLSISDCNVSLDDDKIEGTLTIKELGSFPITGTRKNPKK